MDYKKAGVDIEAGYKSVEMMKEHVKKTMRPEVLGGLGGFSGAFSLAKIKEMEEPVLLSGTDGCGTKVKLAMVLDKHDTIGIDAVAMCVNDVLVQGALPMFFLDYIAVGKNHPQVIEQIVKGVADGCVQAECALIGGETAEMPDMYDEHHYDLAGFCVGAVDRSRLLDGQKIAAGDVLIGLPSSGCHSNGFSLIRKVLLKDAKLDLQATFEELGGKTLAEELLTPTRIYVKAIKHLLDKVDIKGMSHITGGGFYENVPRMLKEGQGVRIDLNSYPSKPIFDLIARCGNIGKQEMCNVFNMGIGFILAVDPGDVEKVQQLLAEIDEPSYVIGEVTDTGSVDLQW